MDEQITDKVITEVFNFYRSITTPFLKRMPDNERENAILWGQKVMDLKNYDSIIKYLTFLTFTIISGHLVSPFDSDAHTAQIPPLPVHLGECKMMEYIEKVVGQCRMPQTQSSPIQNTSGEMTAILSNDETAFLSTQPTPGVGIRLYLATSAQPFAMWSKAEGTPNIVKYNVPAKEVIDRGLSLAKEKFYSYLDELEKRKKAQEEKRCENEIRTQSEVETQSYPLNRNYFKQPDAHRGFHRHQFPLNSSSENSVDDSPDITSSSIGLRSGIPRCFINKQNESTDITSSSLDFRSGNPQSINKRQEEFTCENPRNNVNSTRSAEQGHSPNNQQSFSEEERLEDKKLDERVQRWFSHSIYNPYRGEIKRLIRMGTSVDVVRRSLHAALRQNYKNTDSTHFLIQDSVDESVPFDLRMDHFRKRYMDVLEKDYGITNEGELYYLVGLVTLGEGHMKRARELIRRAEEGLINPALKEKFQSSQVRTCGRLMSLIEELLESTPTSSASTTDASETSHDLHQSRRRQRIFEMPPTSLLQENTDYYADNDLSDQSSHNLENEQASGLFYKNRRPSSSEQGSPNQSQSFDLKKEQPPSNFYNLPDTSQESSICPKESC